MEDDEENRFVDVPERQTQAVEVTVPMMFPGPGLNELLKRILIYPTMVR